MNNKPSNKSFRIISPLKSEIEKISKSIPGKVNKVVTESTKTNQFHYWYCDQLV